MEDKDYLYLEIGTKLSEKYEIVEILGERSNFSIVYIAKKIGSQERVVIKEFFPKNLVLRDMDKISVVCKSSNLQKRYKEGIESFMAEGQIMKKLKNCASAEYIDDFFVNGTSYIVMKYHEGEDLEEYIKKQKIGSYKEFISEIITPLMNTVDELHDMGYLHRDIKPSNVIMEKGEKPILIDFGSSINFKTKEEKKIMVTPGFSPIEFYSEKTNQTKASDVYSISAMLYYYFVGHTPLEATNRIIEDDILRPSEINKAVPKHLEKLILKNLSMNMKERDDSIKKFKNNLKMALHMDKLLEKSLFGGYNF